MSFWHMTQLWHNCVKFDCKSNRLYYATKLLSSSSNPFWCAIMCRQVYNSLWKWKKHSMLPPIAMETFEAHLFHLLSFSFTPISWMPHSPPLCQNMRMRKWYFASSQNPYWLSRHRICNLMSLINSWLILTIFASRIKTCPFNDKKCTETRLEKPKIFLWSVFNFAYI